MDWAWWDTLYFYNAVACLVLGTAGNVITVIVVARSKVLRKYTNSVYLLVLAVLDTACLFITQMEPIYR